MKTVFSMSRHILLALILLSCSPVNAVKLKLIKNLVIEQSMQKQFGNNIYQVQTTPQAYDQGVFRTPVGKDGKRRWRAIDLVYVPPGGLEPLKVIDYTLALDRELGVKYKDHSFAFSGPGRALNYLVSVGWGSENNNGNFIPLLLVESYQEIKQPVYEVFWEHRENGRRDTGGYRDRIYLNYMFKVPVQSKTKWGAAELGRQKESFTRSFSSNSPKVKPDAIIKWFRSGYFKMYHGELNRAPQLLPWKLPNGLKITGFACSLDMTRVFIAESSDTVAAYDTQTGKSLWQKPGHDPLIFHKKHLICLDSKGQNITVLNAETGNSVSTYALPKYLPAAFSSFCICSGEDGKSFLLYVVPEQSSVLCFQIM